MEVFGALGVLLIGAAFIFLGLLALLVPYFVYSIDKHVKLIHQDVSRAIQRDEAKPILRS